MESKVRVYGKAQNRTVLGIANAYLVINPNSTLEDMNKAFPIELNSSKRADTIFVAQSEAKKSKSGKGNSTYEMFFFEHEDETIKLLDGSIILMQELWVKEDFEKMVEWAKQYDIEVAQFEEADKGIGRKGGFRLEFLNGFVPPMPVPIIKEVPVEKIITKEIPVEKIVIKHAKAWIWVLIAALIIIGILLYLLFMRKPAAPVEKVVTQTETVYVEQDEFEPILFKFADSQLCDHGKFILHDVAQLIARHPEYKVEIGGFASKEGTNWFNQRLSERRAAVAKRFLISQGVAEEAITAEGFGSSQATDEAHPRVDRKVIVRIVK